MCITRKQCVQITVLIGKLMSITSQLNVIAFSLIIKQLTSLMIINSILSLVFLWSCRKCAQQLKILTELRKKISHAQIVSVSEAIRQIHASSDKKVFMVIRGLLKLRQKLQGQTSIYSLMELSDIKQGKLSDHLMKKSWSALASNSYWRQPDNIKALAVDLEDMNNSSQKIFIKGCKQVNLSGALNEVYKDTNIIQKSDNMFVNLAMRIYNFFVSRAPFSFLLSTTSVGEELTLYSILNGQYSLVIGQFEKGKNSNQIICKFPNYITKQRSYVQSRLRKKQKKLILVTFLMIMLLIITFIKFIRKVFEYLRLWKRQQVVFEQKEQSRSQNQGENCNCIVCFQNVRTVVFKPCKHYAVCRFCYEQLPKHICPYCKVPIDDIIEIVKRK